MWRDRPGIFVPALVACLLGGPLATAPAGAQAPASFGFTPDHGPPGTLVKIVGAALDSVLAVYFNGVEASVRPVSDLHVKAIVPASATTGPILVETTRGAVVSGRPFVVEPPPGAEAGPRFAGARPNPGVAPVTWHFTLGSAGPARLALFDVGGRRVRLLVDAELPAGAHERAWDGRDDRGRRVPPGVYWARLEAAGRQLRRSLGLLR
jgi:hypothetical protein